MEEIAITSAWHDAVNAGDVDRVLALCTDNVEVGGPRGSGHGAALLRRWVGQAGIQLTPIRWFQRDGAVVVEQRARWRSVDTGEVTGTGDVASAFQVLDGRVASIVRYPDLESALRGTGLSTADEAAGSGGPFPE